MLIHPDRLFPADPSTRAVARRLYEHVENLPFVAPHGPAPLRAGTRRTRPSRIRRSFWVVPDHYIFRMLYSQGIRLEDLGIARRDGAPVETDPAKNLAAVRGALSLFRGTPTRSWLDHAFATLFGLEQRLSGTPTVFDPSRGPRTPSSARACSTFNIEVIDHREPADDLLAPDDPRSGGTGAWSRLPARPVVDPEFWVSPRTSPLLGEITGGYAPGPATSSPTASGRAVLPELRRDLHRPRASGRPAPPDLSGAGRRGPGSAGWPEASPRRRTRSCSGRRC
jgi:glucuronate isomerase